jgi:DNA mismatch endonuclease (patch repair protein)
MADVFSTRERSRIMARIHGVHTNPEKTVRSFLRKSGFRLRFHLASLPGKPDILVPECRTAIFVNGCFWHGHAGCRRAGLPKTRGSFWRAKIAGNIARDKRNKVALKKLGWHVVTVWQCRLSPRKIEKSLSGLLGRLQTLADASPPR